MDWLPDKTDVFVIGGGPAGLAAAIAARRRGFEVVVADSAQPPIDKACGEGLMPDAVTALARLGVLATISHGFPFHGIRFWKAAPRPRPAFRKGMVWVFAARYCISCLLSAR